MKNRTLILTLILILLLPMVFGEIVVNTLGQNNQDTQVTESLDTHTFLINKYYPPSYQPLGKFPSIMVEQLVAEATIDPCQEANLSFKITNSGTMAEIYKFSVEDFDGVAYITPNLFLELGDIRIVQFILRPDCSLHGDLNPVIIVETQTEKAEIPILLHVEKAYDFLLDFEDNITICNGVETRLEVRIENHAGFQNNYSISTSKNWVNSEYGYVVINENSVALFDLILQPNFKTEASSVINVEVKPKYGDSVVKKLTVNTQNCYSQEIRLQNKKVCENTDTLYLNLKNRGLFEETFELLLEEGIFYIESNNITLAPDEEATIPIIIGEATTSKNKLVVKSRIKGIPDTFSKELTEYIEIISLPECYRPTLLTKRITVPKNNETNLLEIFNLGIDDELYLLELNSPDWVSIDEEELFVSKGLTEVVKLSTYPGEHVEEESYDAELILTSTITGNRYVEEFKITVSEFNLLEFINKNKCCLILLSLALLALIFFVKLIFDMQAEGKNLARLIDILIILVIFFIAVIVLTLCFNTFKTKLGLEYQGKINETQNLCLTYYDEDICGSSYYIRFGEDTKFELDLAEWFYDPDNDELFYSYSELNNINLKKEGSFVTLTPDKNWHGIEEIVFYADDGRGGTAESRKFYVHVLNKKEFFMQNFLLDYYVYLFIGLGMILFLTILFLLFLILIN